MERFYPAEEFRIPRKHLMLLAAAIVLALLWFLYAWMSGRAWRIRLLTLFVSSCIIAVSLAQSYWPVLSFGKNAIYDHRPLWFAKKHLIADINSVDLSDSNLYLTHKSEAVYAVDLNRVSKENLSRIEHILSETNIA